MKITRDQIITKAMELYAHNGFANVTVTDLQADLDIGRGTLYYYFPSLGDLFKECIDVYFLKPKTAALNSVDSEKVTIQTMINAILGYLHGLEDRLLEFSNQDVNVTNVVSMMYTAYHQYPDLYTRANKVYKKEKELWRQAIKNSLRAGEIRSDVDIDVMTMLFTHVKDGYDVGLSGTRMDFSIFSREYEYLFTLIKKS